MKKREMQQIRNSLLNNKHIKINNKEYVATNMCGSTLPQIFELNQNREMDFPTFINEIKNLPYKSQVENNDTFLTYPVDNVRSPKELSIKFKDYKEKINFKEFGTGRLYGFELEVERLNLFYLTNEELINIIGKNREWLYFMEEPSLINGFEIISHPCSLEFLEKHLPKLLEDLQLLSLGSFYTAGLHFHVHRSVFGNSTQQQLSHIGNLIKIVNNNFNLIKKMCGRTHDNEYSQNWKNLKSNVELLNIENPLFLGSNKCTDNSEYVHKVLRKDYSTNNGRSEIRNKPINLLKKTTVEFRLPQSTVNYEDFIGRLYLYNELINLSLTNNTEGSLTYYLFKNKNEVFNNFLNKYLYEYHI